MDSTRSIKIDPPLPCAIIKEEGVCGKPAVAGWAWEKPIEESDLIFVPGLWLMQPICKECARKMLEVVNEIDQRWHQE